MLKKNGWDTLKLLGAEKNKTPILAAEAVITALEQARLQHERFATLRKAFFVADEDRLTKHFQKFKASSNKLKLNFKLYVKCKRSTQHGFTNNACPV